MKNLKSEITPDNVEFQSRGHWQKIRRAHGHMLELQENMARWRDESNYSTYTEESTRENGYIATSTRLRIANPIPKEWAVIIGDTLQNLRAALDHLAFAMVDRTTLTKSQVRDIQFPIGSYPDVDAYRAELQRKLFFTQEVGDFLASCRPFKSGDVRFWHLNELAKIDRHRILLTTLAGISDAYRDFRYDSDGMVLKRYDPARNFATIWDAAHPDQMIPVHDGMEIVRETAPAGESSGFTWGIKLELLFDEGDIISAEGVLPVLEALIALTAEAARSAENKKLVLYADE